MSSSDVALVLAATIPAAITAAGGVWAVRASKGLREKVTETHHQVTENQDPTSGPDVPTVLDKLEEVAEIAAATQAQLTTHLAWSDNETRNIWRAIWYAFRTHRDRAELERPGDVPEHEERE